MLLAAVAALVVVAWVLSRRGPTSADTAGMTIAVAFVAAVGGAGGERLYDRAPLALLALAILIPLAAIILGGKPRTGGSANPKR